MAGPPLLAVVPLPPRAAALAGRDGIGLGVAADADRRLLLAVAASSIEAGRDLREADVNAALRTWLAGAGSVLRCDHVELRRWLVDAGFLTRDGYGRRYERGAAAVAQAVAELGEAARDGPAVMRAFAAAREAALAARRERRRLHVAAPQA